MTGTDIQAAAPDGRIEEVIVTAQKREENLQRIPVAASVLTDAQLHDKGISGYAGLTQSIPSASSVTYPSSANTLILSLRGQGVMDPGQIASDGSVGFYEDGFYVARPQAVTYYLVDVERVEVLRGPQSTLYGRNTTGGAINVISKKPSGQWGLQQNLSFGSRNLWRSFTAIDLPAVAGVAAKITLLGSNQDGYVRNSGSGHDYGEERQRAARLALSWDISEVLTARYFSESGHWDSTPLYYQSPDFNGRPLYDAKTPYYAPRHPATRTYRPVNLPVSTSRFEGHGLTLEWQATPDLSVRALTGYRTLQFDAFQDYVEIFGFPYQSADNYQQRQFSEELQLVGSTLAGRVNYVGGLYYFQESGHHESAATLPSFYLNTDRFVKARARSEAIYGQASWQPELADGRWEFTGGVRYTRDHKEARRQLEANGFALEDAASDAARNSDTYGRFTASGAAKWQWRDDANVYAKWSTGYKAGGSLESAPAGQFNQTFGPETITDIELGAKIDALDQRLRVNTALFNSRIRDMQMLIAADPNDPSTFQAYNAGLATIRGLEVGVLGAPSADLRLSLEYTHYFHAAFDRVDVVAGTVLDRAANPLSPYRVGDNVNHLFTIPLVPQHTVVLGLDYTVLRTAPGTLAAHLDYRWQSQQFEAPASGPDVPHRDLSELPAYGLLNGRLSWAMALAERRSLRFELWGQNLLRKKYYQHISGTGGTVVPVLSPRSGSVTEAGVTSQAPAWGPPPAYGIDLVYRYE